jgi:hypothetical protein
LPFKASETDVRLRSFAFIVAFVLASGPGTSLVCKSWCASRDAATATCHHQDSQGARLTDDRTCSGASLDTASFVKKDASRAPNRHDAAVLIPSRVDASAQPALRGTGGHHPSAGLSRHIPTVLRL